MNNATQEIPTTYRLVVDSDTGLTSCAWPFSNLEAAIEAAPHLNVSRVVKGLHSYTHVGRFDGHQLVELRPLEALQ